LVTHIPKTRTFVSIFDAKCPNLLYRIANGGIADLHPNVWWVLIGTNDLGHTGCSEESIVAGNIAIVQELQRLRPTTTTTRIVLNSILPRQSLFQPSIDRINEGLQCYADSTPGVEFFNATDIFWDAKNQTLRGLPDQLHPSVEGSQVWGTAIVQKVLDLIRQ
jgi:lysophospholipase L1-like esterase